MNRCEPWFTQLKVCHQSHRLGPELCRISQKREGHGTKRLARGQICGNKWAKNPSKHGLKGAQNDQKCVLDPKMMLFYHNFILWLKKKFHDREVQKRISPKLIFSLRERIFCAFLAHFFCIFLRIFPGALHCVIRPYLLETPRIDQSVISYDTNNGRGCGCQSF